jgi:hypothetical protein
LRTSTRAWRRSAVDRAESRRRLLEAIDRGEIPHGGPSELAAHDLLDDVPAGYWERWAEGSVERIREQLRERETGPLTREEVDE